MEGPIKTSDSDYLELIYFLKLNMIHSTEKSGDLQQRLINNCYTVVKKKKIKNRNSQSRNLYLI